MAIKAILPSGNSTTPKQKPTTIMNALSESSTITSQRKLWASATEFSYHIESLAVASKNSYVQTIINYCDEHDVDVAAVSNLITKSLKDKLEVEYADMGMLKKQPSIFDTEWWSRQ